MCPRREPILKNVPLTEQMETFMWHWADLSGSVLGNRQRERSVRRPLALCSRDAGALDQRVVTEVVTGSSGTGYFFENWEMTAFSGCWYEGRVWGKERSLGQI